LFDQGSLVSGIVRSFPNTTLIIKELKLYAATINKYLSDVSIVFVFVSVFTKRKEKENLEAEGR
jgi:hypothetical protein